MEKTESVTTMPGPSAWPSKPSTAAGSQWG